jgi:hypothetical protein
MEAMIVKDTLEKEKTAPLQMRTPPGVSLFSGI